jgi:hypothetical protein
VKWIVLSDRNARGQDTNPNPNIRDHSAQEAAPHPAPLNSSESLSCRGRSRVSQING